MLLLLVLAACPALPPTRGLSDTPTAVREHVARARGVRPANVTVTAASSPVVPGVVLYRAVVDGRRWTSATVADGHVLVESAAERAAIARAWAYGATRTVPPPDVAAALLLTLDLDEEPQLVTDPAEVAYLKRLGVEGASVPTETTEDGVPGVRFWYGTGSNPATELIAIFRPDGSVELHEGRSHGGG